MEDISGCQIKQAYIKMQKGGQSVFHGFQNKIQSPGNHKANHIMTQ